MNEHLHLENGRAGGIGTLLLCILGITVAIGGTFAGGRGYSEWQHHRRLFQNDEVMTERLVRLTRYYDLIHQLGDGKSDSMRQQFSVAMASEISKIHSTLGDASTEQQEFAKHICRMIAQDEKIHPGYYQVGNSGGASQTRDMQPVTNDAPKALSGSEK